MELSDQEVGQYRRDGAFCLRGRFVEWLEPLRRGVERNIAEPGPVATEHKLDDGKGRFFEDYCNWERIPQYRAFVLESKAAPIAGRTPTGASLMSRCPCRS